jgi:rhodanese-related sulfurtransferase
MALGRSLQIALLVPVMLLGDLALALDKAQVRPTWHTPFDLYLSAHEAYELKTGDPANVLFVDIRTRQELHYVGLADAVDINIPYQFDTLTWKARSDGVHGTFRKTRNPDFELALRRALAKHGLDEGAPVILMCTSGSRSPLAARALHKAGFTRVYIQAEGFEGIKAKSGPNNGKRVVSGWKFEGLPWRYALPAAKMYFNVDPAASPPSATD